ncbi:10185_t:CDS:2 [Paraglomus occultum]|uniref:10185_t:CDS:1 n=1 Tax=Paraglomus occultum TaxID=144539 RepID=A0A9N9CL08_9GLOM|nr:10185_t:CDS:2 [Paraglomus occultum]
MEADRRSLIDAYILEAVELDLDKKEEKTYDETTDRLAVYPEKEQVVGTSIVASPTFCTIEAKRDEAFSAGEGEALGQMLALRQKCRSPIHGCLTDGMRWTFYYYYVDEELLPKQDLYR